MPGMENGRHPASFRDPSGFVFSQDGVVYRAVLPAYKEDYNRLMQSGLYARLMEQGLMIAHEEAEDVQVRPTPYKVLRPEQLSFWTYPYEWSFGQLKDAALLTLRLAATGLEYGMLLKDASAYNIQFVAGTPVLIDSLSFERYKEGEAWQAFTQFCAHFLYPLLVFQTHPGLSPAMLMAYPDGLSAQLTAGLLPWRSRLSLNKQLYVYLAAAVAGKKAATTTTTARKISSKKIGQNIAQLRDYISGLQPPKGGVVWSNYYDETVISQAYLLNKASVITAILEELKPQRVVDAGCNTGGFSMMAARFAEEVIALDSDAASMHVLYGNMRRERFRNMHLLVADITNPTPATGWANGERSALTDRVSGDMVFALALVHHLALSKNIPLTNISALLAGITSKWLLIEFVPKSDPKAALLLQSRKDIFTEYSQDHFEHALLPHFRIEHRIPLKHSERTLYVLRKT